MIKYVNECCDCAVPAYPCVGNACTLTHVPHYYCDKCGDEIDPDYLYQVDGDHLCEECLKEMFKIDPEDEYYD